MISDILISDIMIICYVSLMFVELFPPYSGVFVARVLHIYPMQMNLAIGSYAGRVHVTAVCDEIKSVSF